ncbi:uncharacterized protein B0H18DRAFT_95851 [Fomitopsis serialis]|uniref:uncharacterized protein n=1 Tax=Fomitopsis serialis TaxID=139415 RepID=UPI00200753B5|nr:uncharacterized protein B0H18DRAFT_95851 [Neoantrodia serialis]KAH9915492.1 hypothetical protein B0H18DRAFT_95851 [Neoantrodia serialis]
MDAVRQGYLINASQELECDSVPRPVDWDTYYWAPVPSKHVYPLPRSLSRRIPLDVFYNVFSHLYTETERSSVALVCREWYRCSGHIRYPDLCIRDREGLIILRDLCLNRDARVRQRLSRTTTLRIHQRYGDVRFCDSVPLVLGACMPDVRNLVFEGCIRPSMHLTFTRGLRLFRNLRSLEIVDFVLASFGQLRRIILASPQLDTLVLRDGKYALPVRPQASALSLAPSERPQTHVSVPHLQRLELCHLDIGLLAALVDWFVTVHPPCCQHVTYLTITEVTGGAHLLTRLLQVIGPSLEHISLAGMPGRSTSSLSTVPLPSLKVC